MNLSYHTKNVGTLLYASPEQLKENYYNEKSDIYSLGFILFEMVYPLKTAMEKNQRFKELRESLKLPENLSRNYASLCSLILDMIAVNSEQRPEASLVYQRIINEISQLEEVSEKEESQFKFETKTDETKWSESYVRIINNKLLVLPNGSSAKAKAQFIYDLKECDVKVNEDGYLEVDHPFLSKLHLKSESAQLVKSFSLKLKSFL